MEWDSLRSWLVLVSSMSLNFWKALLSEEARLKVHEVAGSAKLGPLE